MIKTYSDMSLSQFQSISIIGNLIFFTVLLDILLLNPLDEEVESVGVHDGDDDQAREAEHHGEDADVQLRLIGSTVKAIGLGVPAMTW